MTARDTEHFVDEALEECSLLSELLHQERKAIVAFDATKLGACTENKEALRRKLEQRSQRLASTPKEVLTSLQPSILARLKGTLRALRSELVRNDAMLQFAHELSRAALGGGEVTTGYDARGARTMESEARVRVRV